MSRSRKKLRKVRPVIFVFCEGETEENFVQYLKSKYRCPIEIKTKISKTKIRQKGYVQRNTDGVISRFDDRIYLLYDLDVEGIYEALSNISGTELISSNPCFELWLLFHFADCTSSKSASECRHLLQNHLPHYIKGERRVFEQNRQLLEDNYDQAKARGLATNPPNNPSSDVYRLVDYIRSISNNQMR